MQMEAVTDSTANFTNTTTAVALFDEADLHYDRFEFIKLKPEVAIISISILSIEAIMGTVGNIITILVFVTQNNMRKVEHIFMMNLVISDFYVTSVADPMAIVAKVEGKQFFDKFPGLCHVVGSLCTVSCFTSLASIGLMSVNRFVYICANDKYRRIFTKRSSILMCISEYLVGAIFVLLNQADIGDHKFDHKILECIWDRMTTYPYTVVFFVILVWIPSTVIGACYLKIYLFVRAHKDRMKEQQNIPKTKIQSFRLAKTLFLIYAVFVTCWAPYAILAVVDAKNKAPHEIYVFIVIFAHLHPSVNWLIYYKTNRQFAIGFRKLFRRCDKNAPNDEVTEITHSNVLSSTKY